MYYTHLDTPIGAFLLVGDEDRLTMTSFSSGHQRRAPEAGWVEDAGALARAVTQFQEYFAGERDRFDLPLALRGTPFQRDVWAVLQSIPFGQTRSYGEVARALGKPGASRAVGTANAANHLPVVVPCHRVIGADGGLTGFGGGLEAKRWLLRHEGALPERQAELF
jgi:methylated-DNA-[protein]-cysteine S-methyltransferase